MEQYYASSVNWAVLKRSTACFGASLILSIPIIACSVPIISAIIKLSQPDSKIKALNELNVSIFSLFILIMWFIIFSTNTLRCLSMNLVYPLISRFCEIYMLPRHKIVFDIIASSILSIGLSTIIYGISFLFALSYQSSAILSSYCQLTLIASIVSTFLHSWFRSDDIKAHLNPLTSSRMHGLLPMIPLDLMKDMYIMLVVLVRESCFIAIVSSPLSASIHRYLSYILKNTYIQQLPILPLILFSAVVSYLNILMWQSLLRLIDVYASYPLDFTKMIRNRLYNNVDCISMPILSGIFKPTAAVTSLIPSPSMGVGGDMITYELSHPIWYKLQQQNRLLADNLLDKISQNDYGRAHVLGDQNGYSLRSIINSMVHRLAYQDLSRLSKGSPVRRSNLFENKKLFEFGYSLCGFIDSVTLQVS